MRKPWEGSEIELEKILQLQQNKILEDSISEITIRVPDLSFDKDGNERKVSQDEDDENMSI